MKAHTYPLLLAALLELTSCEKNIPVYSALSTANVEITHARTEKGDYRIGEDVSFSMNLLNNTTESMNIAEVVIRLRDMSVSTFPILYEKSIIVHKMMAPHSIQTVEALRFFKIPALSAQGSKALGVVVDCVFADGTKKTFDATFFRVVDNNSLLVYDVKHSSYNDLDIFTLTGGMSPEFAVQNTLASLACGISHSWNEAPNTGGPHPVLSTPDFLERSIKKTISLYEDVIGAKAKVKTLIIGTGVPSVSYLATSMSAVYLPIHFLVSSNSVSEIQSMLNYSNDAGYSAYATFGYDGSIPNEGVAWLKLLDLPKEYKKFILDHNVEEVIMFGVRENAFGETFARKLIVGNSTTTYNPGSIYILYTQSGSIADVEALTRCIYDFPKLNLAEGANIADWESGIINSQIVNFTSAIKAQTSAKPYSITSDDMINLYNLSSYLVLKSIQNNQTKLNSPCVTGVAFNEYLVSHPQYELFSGQIPLLYWQFVPVSTTVDRCFGYLKSAISAYFPTIGLSLNKQQFFLNSNYGRNEIRSALLAKSVNNANIAIRDQADGDRWNPQNGMFSPCEIYARNIVENIGVNQYVTLMKSIVPLLVTDVHDLCSQTGNVDFISN